MVRRKERVPVLLDTNVLARALLYPHAQSPSARILSLWKQRRIQLVVSDRVVEEYFEILDRLGVSAERVRRLAERLAGKETVTVVNLGRRLRVARDPEDEVILSTADAGRVDYLVRLDKDLLELPWDERRRFKFQIVTPAQFLDAIE